MRECPVRELLCSIGPHKRFYFSLVMASMFCIIFYNTYLSTINNPELQELLYYQTQQRNECQVNGIATENESVVKEKQEIVEWTDRLFTRPKCAGLLQNITIGKWKIDEPMNEDLSKELKKIHQNYRKKTGIPIHPWRTDHRCGYRILADRVSFSWPRIASFCDPQSSRPCCSDQLNGYCVPVTKELTCDCPNCIDTRKYKDALLAHWTTKDKRCSWKNFTSLEACAVLNRLSRHENKAHVHFIGDSLMRNMFLGITTLLTANRKNGAWRKCVSDKLKKLCKGENLFLMRPCHDLAAVHNLHDLQEVNGSLCNNHRNFEAEYNEYGMPSLAADFVKFATNVKGNENSYFVVGVGLHFQCNAEKVIKMFLEPAIRELDYSDTSWPRLIWVHPLSIGLLKPPRYLNTQGDVAISQFGVKMEKYLKDYRIPALDFKYITKGVHSYDGTHYGAGVNIMKAQILLNYLATL
ncbi:unnamed protein product [Clavelina lepadiformis]|uniref:Uncharacterized protein n=1 Tax=Clavelina lepadiformis TaxID=159417 RepID=A0ABP0G6V2_CLALP